jgi:hypothetical protein
MATQTKADVQDLEHRIGQLQKNLAFVGRGSTADASELFTIIHRPGFTTPQQVALAAQMLDAMNQQAVAMRGIRDALENHIKASGG